MSLMKGKGLIMRTMRDLLPGISKTCGSWAEQFTYLGDALKKGYTVMKN